MQVTTQPSQPVNILLVDDQPAKLLSYEAMLSSLGENLIRAHSGKEALELLLRKDVAVIVMDVCMPELDGFELAALIRRHPRYQKTAIIHVSAVNLTDLDRVKGYDSGAVDYVAVPVVPEVLRAKVKVFADVYRQTATLERLHRDAAAKLGQSEERFRVLAETIPSFVWTAGADGTLLWANQRWLRYIGMTLEESRQGWQERVIHPDDRERWQLSWSGAARKGEEFEVEARGQSQDGSFRWLLTRAVPEKDGTGRVTRWFGVTTDIHDQKRLAEGLREADRRKDEFLAMLSHELRNPLAAIDGALEVVRHSRRSPQQAELALERIERQSRHLRRLIDDLLDVSRIAKDKLQLRRESVDLAEIVNAAVESCSRLAGRALSVELPAEPIPLRADRARLVQTLQNLLDNAAKFTPADGRIGVTAQRDGSEAVLRVSDSGSGIAREALPQVFEMFYQADQSLERAQGGLGLGLTLARRLVELHGGTIEASSAGPGQGSEFVLRLPIADERAEGPEPAGAAPDAVAQAGRRVLIADDNEDAAESLALLLSLAGHEVQTAGDGEEAVAVAEQFRPQVALLDLGMPRLSGHDVARRLRQQPWAKDLLLVAVTGWSQAEEFQRTREAGFDAHLVKPVDSRTLMKLLTGPQERSPGG
jgi:two-component system CheB/CheR fusion protein